MARTMNESDSDVGPFNRSVALQLWVIGALGPLIYFLSVELGKNDFVALWIAGKQALAGEAANVYDLMATGAYASILGKGKATIFPYPPNALPIFMPFSALPYLAAYWIWATASLAFFAYCARPYCDGRLPLVMAILTPASIACFAFGQTGLLFGGLWLLAFRGKWVAVALLTFKPHLGFLSILSLRTRAAFVKTCLLVVIVFAATIVVFGFDLWRSFLEHSIGHAARIDNLARWKFLGVTPAIGYGIAGWIPFAAIGALLLARNVNVFTVATASFLISPYGFNYDMVVASLGFGLLVAERWTVMPIRHRIPTAIGFLSPAIAMTGNWWMPPLIAWALWAQVQYSSGSPRY